MLQEEAYAEIDRILAPWRQLIGRDYEGYHHHVCRVVSFAALLQGDETVLEKWVIAGCFHDLGIWAEHTFDYLEPSISLANRYLTEHGLERWTAEISAMIEWHHKVTPCDRALGPLAEAFRRADWIDVTLGVRAFGLSRAAIQKIRRRFPNAGFHRCLTRLTLARTLRYPTSPLPMFRW